MLALTGATGNLGSRVLASILEHHLIPPDQLVVVSSSSDTSRLPESAQRAGIQVRYGNLDEPQSLVPAYTGCDALFLVSYPSPAEDRWKRHKHAIDAAKEAGVKTVIYTSLMFGGQSGMESVAGVQQAHIETVRLLMGSGLEYVVVREGIYAESWWLYAGFQPTKPLSSTIAKGGEGEVQQLDVVIPRDGPVAWVGWDDLGEGTARILAEYNKYLGRTLNLTGYKTMTVTEVARCLEKTSSAIRVEVKLVGREEAARYHKQKKSAEDWVVDSWSRWYDGIAAGETAVVDPLLEELLGRRPKGIEELASTLFGA